MRSIYLDFSKAFDTMSCKTALEKLTKSSDDEPIARWMKAVWPSGSSQRDQWHKARLLTSGVPQQSILHTALLNTTLSKLADDKLEGVHLGTPPQAVEMG